MVPEDAFEGCIAKEDFIRKLRGYMADDLETKGVQKQSRTRAQHWCTSWKKDRPEKHQSLKMSALRTLTPVGVMTCFKLGKRGRMYGKL